MPRSAATVRLLGGKRRGVGLPGYGYRLLRQPVSVVLHRSPGPAPCAVVSCLPHHSSPRPLAVRAQSLFGDRPIRMIVPVAAAGGVRYRARIMADAITPLLRRPIVVENLAGACSSLAPTPSSKRGGWGRRSMSHQQPRAHELIYPQFAYDPRRIFVAVALVSASPSCLPCIPRCPRIACRS